MTESEPDAEFASLTGKISRERGFSCNAYKEKCLRRRIAVRMRARGVHTYADYVRILDEDSTEYDRLLDALTINVTKLFRNWETFEAVERLVVPELMARGDGPIDLWSAGCASGEEAYSLAILLHRYAAAAGTPESLRRISVLGTDIDRPSLARAEAGVFDESAFADTPRAIRDEYFAPVPPFSVCPEVRALVRFEWQNLVAAELPAGSVDLIACRNVIIYFDRDTQEQLFARFRDALRPGGFLVLGKVETLLGPARGDFVAVEPRQRIYRRP